MNRRKFLQSLSAAAVLPSEILEYKNPVLNLHKFSATPVKIESIDLLQAHNLYFLRTRSTDGAEGLILTKDMEDFIPILHRRVIRKHFLTKTPATSKP